MLKKLTFFHHLRTHCYHSKKTFRGPRLYRFDTKDRDRSGTAGSGEKGKGNGGQAGTMCEDSRTGYRPFFLMAHATRTHCGIISTQMMCMAGEATVGG